MLKVEYREGFKGRPTVLFAGGKPDLEQLLGVIREWDGRELDLVADLKRRGQTSCEGISVINLIRGANKADSSMALAKTICTWSLSNDGHRKVVGLLQGTVDAKEPCHQYLDLGDPKGLQIVCSLDEYA